MTKLNININNKPYGKGEYVKDNFSLFKKGVITTAFALGTLSLAACGKNKDEIVIDKKEVKPAVFEINQGNGTVVFTTKEHVEEYGYVLDDNIDKQVEWAENEYQELMRLSEQPNVTVAPGFYDIKDLHDNFMNQYDEYIDLGSTFERDNFIKDRLKHYIEELTPWVGEEYKPALVDKMEIDRVNDINEINSFYGPYYKVDDYRITKDSTLSGIVDTYADNQDQYKVIYSQAIKDNNIQDEDLIYAGDTLKLTGFDRKDLEDIGYTITDEELVDAYVEYFKSVRELGYNYISGDSRAVSAKDDIELEIGRFLRDAEDPKERVHLVSKGDEICKMLYLNYGYEMPTLTAHKRK